MSQEAPIDPTNDTNETEHSSDTAKEYSIRFYVEGPGGDVYAAETSSFTLLRDIAADFFADRGWPTHDAAGRHSRMVVEHVDKNNPEKTKRLRADLTLHESGIHNEDTLRIFPEAVAGCFLGCVNITLANGDRKSIQEIAIGDILLSYNPMSEEFSDARVENIYIGSVSRHLTINQSLYITEDHLVWSSRGWIRAQELKPGDTLLNVSGRTSPINSVCVNTGSFTVYNLHVSSIEHTFFAADILVHNATSKLQIPSDLVVKP